jgi:hypothetical protein
MQRPAKKPKLTKDTSGLLDAASSNLDDDQMLLEWDEKDFETWIQSTENVLLFDIFCNETIFS